MTTYLWYQLQLFNGVNRRLTLKHNPKTDRTIGDKIWRKIQEMQKQYFIEINLCIKTM